MACHTTRIIPEDAWIKIKEADVTAFTFQSLPTKVQHTAGPAPTSEDGVVGYDNAAGGIAIPLAQLAPGIEDANRIWVSFDDFGGPVAVTHA
ncbi:hypothetical protein [Jannaschia donghaensis]|uniref:Uncharacterized protein n=1 Tax=Jannaschia donghaensis TaxID=420998 RepID=A0A0M6YL82_9RHOB|nr:hypothetical protein [Jannaschia donghaensis]CTQ50283.1 hypothetical protein JDO7802_02303 [Jannaschia donghaensis]